MDRIAGRAYNRVLVIFSSIFVLLLICSGLAISAQTMPTPNDSPQKYPFTLSPDNSSVTINGRAWELSGLSVAWTSSQKQAQHIPSQSSRIHARRRRVARVSSSYRNR
jgi:hypothetical protein